MHENRETSVAPVQSAGRSAKAQCRNADMHAAEESHWGIVPVNQPNKEGQPSAEVGEGRPQTGENSDRSNMRPTPSGQRMSQGWVGVRRAVLEREAGVLPPYSSVRFDVRIRGKSRVR
jgi:hypothetical protein